LVVVALVAATSVTTWVVAGAAMKGKISGCVDDQTGEIDQMRFGKTPKGGECDEGETAFTWNVRGRRGAQGPEGPQGPQGPAGTGGIGPPGVSGWERVVGICAPVGSPDVEILGVSCPAGKTLLSGGGGWFPTPACTGGVASVGLALSSSYPISETTWRLNGANDTGATVYLQPYAICANVAP
jgi:hypothetical protein